MVDKIEGKSMNEPIDNTVQALITLLQGDDYYERSNAADTLGRMGAVEAVPFLRQALKDEGFYVRRSAAIALGLLKQPEATEDLIPALQDEEYEVQEYTAIALGKIGDKRAVKALNQTLKNENGALVTYAAKALIELGEDPIPLLIELLKDNNVKIRISAVSALNELPDPKIIEPLIEVFDDEESDVSGWAASAVGEVGSVAVPFLLVALKSQNALVRGNAVYGLSCTKDERAVEPIIAALKDYKALVRWEAARALGDIGDARALPALQKVAEEEDSLTPGLDPEKRPSNAALKAIEAIKSRNVKE